MSAKPTQENEWQSLQDRLAESSGLAIVVVDETSPDLAKSNNNSICQVLYNSDEFAPECAKFCGRAFEWATEAGKTVEYKCYAGLNCAAIPVKTKTKQLVAIVGRTF
jgi:ligand-binding sensor protein